MSLITFFVVYSILLWSFVAILTIIVHLINQD